jgi:hypothetical protein
MKKSSCVNCGKVIVWEPPDTSLGWDGFWYHEEILTDAYSGECGKPENKNEV